MAARWKEREAEAAALFGSRRNVLSGSSGREDRDGSDTTNPRLWIEVKTLAKTAVRTLWDRTRALAARKPHALREGRRAPVLVIYDKNKKGGLIVVHQDDFAEVAAEYLAAQDEAAVMEFERAVRVRRLGIIGEDD
jgi:hypothetical protein